MSKAIQIKVVEALDKIGKSNGTALPNVAPPDDINDKDAWDADRKATFELLIAQQIASYAEKRVKNAKAGVVDCFGDTISKIKPGSSNTIVRGNTALNVEVRNPPERLDRALLVSAMAKRSIKLEDIEEILKEGSGSTKPPTYYKPSIVA